MELSVHLRLKPAIAGFFLKVPMQHFMCDLETLGLKNNSVIVSIGVVEFNEVAIGRHFYVNVDKESCLQAGLVIDQSTVDWWSKQSKEAIDAWQHDSVPLADALTKLNRYLEQADGGLGNVKLWGNGAGFDNVLLKSAYRAVDADEPWKYYNNRCYRTAAAMFPLLPTESPERRGTYHNALDDAITQTLRLQVMLHKYKVPLL